MKTGIECPVRIQAQTARLEGVLGLPPLAKGIVLFAHGSGSGRFSPRNRYVAEELQRVGIATLLMDLLEESEAEDRENVFDINLLTTRLLSGTDWVAENPETKDLRIGYFGASTGAAAALLAAAKRRQQIGAVVSRGGRPDLALEHLPTVTAPTLLIVGGDDHPVIPLNQDAYSALHCPKEIVIVPGATHLFEEPGALEEVARLAGKWFGEHLTGD